MWVTAGAAAVWVTASVSLTVADCGIQGEAIIYRFTASVSLTIAVCGIATGRGQGEAIICRFRKGRPEGGGPKGGGAEAPPRIPELGPELVPELGPEFVPELVPEQGPEFYPSWDFARGDRHSDRGRP